MSLFRDSWEVWRRKVNTALGGLTEPVKAEDVTYDNTDSGLTATDVQSAVDEVAGAVSDNTTDITALKGKKFKTTQLFKGDASTGGSSGVEVSVDNLDDYDELMIYYNAGNECARVPVALFKTEMTTLRVQATTNGTLVSATVVYSDSKVIVNATQDSTFYLIGIQYNA